MIVFAAAYVAMFGISALLHRHARARAAALELDALELLETRRSIAEHLVNVAIAHVSMGITVGVAFTPLPLRAFARHMGGRPGFAAAPGRMVYALPWPIMLVARRGFRRERAALLATRDADPPALPAAPVEQAPRQAPA